MGRRWVQKSTFPDSGLGDWTSATIGSCQLEAFVQDAACPAWHSRPGQVGSIVVTLLDYFTCCCSQRLPLTLVSPNVYIRFPCEKGFLCYWITWTVLSLLVLLPVGAYLFTHWDAWTSVCSHNLLACLNFLPSALTCLLPSPAWNRLGFEVKQLESCGCLKAFFPSPGLPQKCRPKPSRFGLNATSCSCL